MVSSKEPDESCDSDLMDEETPPLPPAEGQPSVFGLRGPPMDDPVQGVKAKRLKTGDPNTPAHGVGHDPALFGQHTQVFQKQLLLGPVTRLPSQSLVFVAFLVPKLLICRKR